jgi:hypothetical protein
LQFLLPHILSCFFQSLLKSFPDVLHRILLHSLVQSIPNFLGQGFNLLPCLILFTHCNTSLSRDAFK